MDYERAYKAVLKTATQWIKDGCTDKEKICLECVFPELRESEDESIRKSIADCVSLMGEDDDVFSNHNVTKVQVLAWLKKQKINTEGDFGRGYDCGYEACLNSHGAEWFEKQKEQKHPNGCFTCDEYKKCYEEGRRNGFTAGYNKAMKEVEQKEQKPVENEKVEITDFEQSVYDLCPVLGIEEAKATASDLLELAKKTLLKTGKVVLASNYPEGCSFEDGFHLGYNEGFNATQKEQKPAEWSEEDENMRNNILRVLSEFVGTVECESNPSLSASYLTYSREIAWLKSLRPQGSKDSLQTHWKPSEEQMKMLAMFTNLRCASRREANTLESLYNDLKKLM